MHTVDTYKKTKRTGQREIKRKTNTFSVFFVTNVGGFMVKGSNDVHRLSLCKSRRQWASEQYRNLSETDIQEIVSKLNTKADLLFPNKKNNITGTITHKTSLHSFKRGFGLVLHTSLPHQRGHTGMDQQGLGGYR